MRFENVLVKIQQKEWRIIYKVAAIFRKLNEFVLFVKIEKLWKKVYVKFKENKA